MQWDFEKPPRKLVPAVLPHSTVRHDHALVRLPRLVADHLHLPEHVEALDHLAEDDVLTVQPRRGVDGDEELRAVGVRSCTPGVGAE